MAAGVAKVVLKCQDAMETQQLDLSRCLLESFPLAVYHLVRNVSLIKCNLSHNKLKLLDSKFSKNFDALTELNISHNELHKLPENINLLQELVNLDASQNKLNTIPASLYNLEKLQTLDLSDNDISVLDVEKLCNMPALRKVSLMGNPLNDELQQKLATTAKFELLLPVADENFSDVD
ncbi:leucine-rich repeat-containing protein 20-like [Apostichopus japonicus]